MSTQTKTVSGYFGAKEVSRDEFVKQWVDHFAQFYNLADTVAEFEELKVMKDRLAELAGAKWDSMK